jgi:MinD superfamily P-loop ATPase
MKELVVISGKGGTGKTTITACLAALAKDKVLVDADVDAADLFILLAPETRRKETFRSGQVARIDAALCTSCAKCVDACRYGAISPQLQVDGVDCEGCGLCARICPTQAIGMRECVSGDWFISETRYGPFVHARLKPGGENSGKLVTMVRQNARLIAEDRGLDWILVDGPPGIGCPVISSLTGAAAVLIVTEPTPAGIHDMKRVAELAAYFKIPSAVCINKWDLSPEKTEEIAAFCAGEGIAFAGRIPYDRTVVDSLVKRRILVEYAPDAPAAREVLTLWTRMQGMFA